MNRISLKLITIVFIVVVLAGMPMTTALADDLVEVRLNQAIQGNTPFAASSNFEHMDCGNVWNEYNIDVSDPDTGYTFWHLVSNGGTSEYAVITFRDAYGADQDPITVYPSEVNSSTVHYCILAPAGWMILDGYSYLSAADSNPMFNISHSGEYKPPLGSLKVTADVAKQHTKITYQPYWQRTYQPQWQRTYQPYWQRTYQPQWQRTYQPYWQKTYQPVWQKTIQPYDVPTFRRAISHAGDSTLVTRLTYSGNTSKAIPINGGVFKNGHTYVKLNVAEASAPGGVWYTIADSSYNSNGKKTPDQYNRPIDYQYNVKIIDGKLTISYDERLVSASVGAIVVNDPKQFPGSAPTHYPNTVTVDMPATTDNGYVYMYVHFEGGITWYTTGEYEFAGRIFDHSDMKSDEWDHDVLVSDKWDHDVLVSDKWDHDALVSDKWDHDVLVSDKWDHDALVSDKWDHDVLVSDKWDHDVKISEETITDVYNATFSMVVKNSNDSVVFNGTIGNLGEANIGNLVPGIYSVTLSGSDIGSVTKYVTVVAGAQASVAFNDIPTVIGPTESVYLDKIYLPDIYLEKIYLDDIYLEKTYLDDIYLDKDYLDDVYLDKDYLDDIYLDKVYLDDIYLGKTYLPDIVLPVIHLGDDSDPFGPYAVRLN